MILVALSSSQLPLFRAFARQSYPSPAQTKLSPSIEVLTDTQGVDFGPYVAAMFKSLMARWYRDMPEDVQLGEAGKVIVRFRILQDGSVPTDSLKIETTTSKRKLLGSTSLKAVQKSSPFERLPTQFTGEFIDLRVTFFYNLDPAKNH